MRAVSIQTGYLIEGTGAKSCTITYLAQVDPKGERGTPSSVPWGSAPSSPPLCHCVLGAGAVGSWWNSGGFSGVSQVLSVGSLGVQGGLYWGFGLSGGSRVAWWAQGWLGKAEWALTWT